MAEDSDFPGGRVGLTFVDTPFILHPPYSIAERYSGLKPAMVFPLKINIYRTVINITNYCVLKSLVLRPLRGRMIQLCRITCPAYHFGRY
jgi:hypothetical protein